MLAAGIDLHIIFRFWKNGLFCLVHARLFLPLTVRSLRGAFKITNKSNVTAKNIPFEYLFF